MRSPAQRRLGAYKNLQGLTYEGLAAELAAVRPDLGDCKWRTVQDLIRGERNPSASMAAKIEAHPDLKIPVGDWFPEPAA